MSEAPGVRRWSRGQAKGIVAATALVLACLMAVFAVLLANSQADAHDRVVSRFHDRAQVASALTQAVLSTVSIPESQIRELSAAKLDTALLDRVATADKAQFLAVLDAKGRVLGTSTGVTPAIRSRITTSPAVREALGGARLWVADVHEGAKPGANTVDLALAFGSGAGRRVLVSGSPVAALAAFMGSYLRRVPTQSGTAFVLDSGGRVVGARAPAVAAGVMVPEAGLAGAMRDSSTGSYGKGRYFASAPVPGTTWKVVLTASESSLFSSVAGSRHWLPWIVFIAFGVVAALCLGLLWLVLGNAVSLSQANSLLVGSNKRLQNTNALLRHAAELARSNAELEQFASIASHDLQEPLRKVQTFADQLTATEQERLSDQGKDFLRRMNDAAGRMRSLIDDLLTFSRVSTQGRPFVPVDLGEVAGEAISDLEVRIAETGAHVTVGELPTIAADPVQMSQLLHNLIGNALKFAREGVTPEVDVDAQVAGGIAVLTVRDNGIGFEDKYAGRIFRAFERLNGATAYPGTGIGLALCRKIVERHHGTIGAEGRLGEGATFTVRLPVEQPDDGPASTSLFPDEDEVSPRALA